MNNLNLARHTPFSFLAVENKKPTNNSCGLAWIDDSFHLHGNNYYVYTCHTCQKKKIKKGKPPKVVLNWGGQDE